MITRNALYSFVESLIDAAANGEPLFEASSFRNIRTFVDEAEKVVRVECFDGQFCMSEEDVRKELGVRFTVQCWVLPEDDEQTSIDTAVDLSFEMARTIFEGIAGNADLNGQVCDAYGDQFETGEANLGRQRRGVTYLDGIINRAS
jgi:hypothetical protein